MNRLEQAIRLAIEFHEGQVDKAGLPLDHLPESEQGISKRYHRASAYLIARV